jgi:DNA-directed RNA polymerase subunit omega
MARITIEDCIEQVPNRFHLVQMTAIRAKQLKKGANALVQSEENKEVVVALREIAAGLVSPDFPVANAEEEILAESEEAPAAEPTEPAEAAEEGEAPAPTE